MFWIFYILFQSLEQYNKRTKIKTLNNSIDMCTNLVVTIKKSIIKKKLS